MSYEWRSIKGKGAKLATVNFQMDNFSTRKLDGAKPYIINQNGTNLAMPLIDLNSFSSPKKVNQN